MLLLALPLALPDIIRETRVWQLEDNLSDTRKDYTA